MLVYLNQLFNPNLRRGGGGGGVVLAPVGFPLKTQKQLKL